MGIIARHVLTAQGGNVPSARLILEIAGMLQKDNPENNFNVNIGKDDDNIVICLPPKDPE